MKKIFVSFLLVHGITIFAEDKKDFDFFEKYKQHNLLTRFVGDTVDMDNFGMLSESKHPQLSSQSNARYNLMKERCAIGKSVVLDDVDIHNNRFIFMCASSRQKLLALLEDQESKYIEALYQRGKTLQEGHVIFYSAFHNEKDAVAVAIAVDSINSDIDSVHLAHTVFELVKKNDFGIHIIHGCPVKLTLLKNFKQKIKNRSENEILKSIDYSKFVPTQEEVTKAKLKVRN